MRFGFLALAAALAVCVPALAQAQTPQPAAGQPKNDAERFKDYATSEGYKKTVGQLATMGSTVSRPDCKDHKAMDRAELIFYTFPKFGDLYHPISGLWHDRVRMDVCGEKTYQNVLMEAQNGTVPKLALLMPGMTQATPQLQNVILRDVIEALATKKCSDTTQIFPMDTQVGKESKPRKLDKAGLLIEGAWKETWVFRACGQTVKANVDLTATGKGGVTHKVKL